MKWFVGAAFLAAFVMLREGAPPLAIAAGVIGAAAWKFWRWRSETASVQNTTQVKPVRTGSR